MTTPTRTTDPAGAGGTARYSLRGLRLARRSPGAPDRNPLTRGDRAGLWLMLALAVAYGTWTLVTGVIFAVGYLPVFAGGSTEMTLLARGAVPTGTLAGSATLVGGEYSEATVQVEGLSGFATSLLLSGSIVATLTRLAVVGAVLYLTVRLLRGSPFLRSVTTGAVIAAIAVMVGGMATQALHGFAQMQIVTELTDDFTTSPLYLGFTIDPTPFAIGFGLGVVATAFQLAERLQRDTEGLV